MPKSPFIFLDNCLYTKGLVSMGYYDSDYENGRQSRRGRRGWFFSSIIGAVIGALLVVMLVPTLSRWGVLPYDIAVNENTTEHAIDTKPAEPGIQRNVSVNVASEVTNAVDKVSEAVVGVVNIQETSFWSQGPQEAGTGSGVIYKKSGDTAFVVTNNHVVEGANQLEVTLEDGTRIKAHLLGSDVWTDLAVLEIKGKEVEKIKTVATFGNSDSIQVGEPAIAIGNPLGSMFSGSVTQGIISGTNRTIPIDINKDGMIDWQAEVLQTDAAINPGNSGGALVNIAGEVIGINSMKIAEQAVEGIGLAIPINFAKPIINDLEKFGEVRRPYMGISLKSLNEIPTYHWQETLRLPSKVKDGVAILEVVPNSPASRAGLQQYDVIVELDGHKIKDVLELRKYLYNDKKVGQTMKVTFYRGGKEQTATMKLAKETF